jgi:hypothetical protein
MSTLRITFALVSLVCTNAFAQTSFWPDSAIPGLPDVANSASVTLGLRFHSDVPGVITGVQFYKGSDNTGTHTGTLWSSTGAKLASVTFSNETASGWQQANFSAPVNITANTSYVVAYTAPNGGHAHDQYYPWSNLNSGPLQVEGSAPGVFTYGSGVLFPTSTWNSSNYWVDVIFSPTTTQSSFWPNSATPGLPQVWNTSAVTLGLQFYSDVAGSVTGIQFYKGANNTGTHVGTLWTAAGNQLARVTFSNETAFGWQQANFSTPVPIAANTPYVISYTAPNGAHAQDQYYSWSNLQSGPLHVADSSPGVYVYGSGVLFPTNTWNAANYWVDLIFTPGGGTAPLPPDSGPSPAPPSSPSSYTISGNVSGSSATLTLSGAASGSTKTDTSGNYSFTGLANGVYIVAASQAGYTFSPSISTVTINDAPVTGLTFLSTAVLIPIPHSVILTWNVSTSSDLRGYAVYRAETAGGAFTKLTGSPVLITTYTDTTVASGRTYYYVTTAVDANNAESSYSNQAVAVVPSP